MNNDTPKTNAAVNAGGHQLLNVTECSRELERENVRLREALTRLLSSDPEVAKCSDDELSAAVENAPAPEIREQAGAVLRARRVLSA